MKIRYVLPLYFILSSHLCFGMNQDEYQPKTRIEKVVQKIANSSLWTKWCNYLLELGKDVDSCESYKANTWDDNPDRINTFDKINIPTIDQHNLTQIVSNDVFAMQNNNKTISVRIKKKKIHMELRNDRLYITFTLGKKPYEAVYEADVTRRFSYDFFDNRDPIIICLNGKRKGKSPTNIMLNNALDWIEKNENAIWAAKRKLLSKDKQHVREYRQYLKKLPTTNHVTQTMHREFGFVIVNQETMPGLYTMVKNLTEKLNLPTPLILLSNKYKSGGARVVNYIPWFPVLVIGENLFLSHSTPALEAIIAHEMSHLYCNHIFKNVLAAVFIFLFDLVTARFFSQQELVNNTYINTTITWLIFIFSLMVLQKTVLPLTLNALSRHFEKQADFWGASIIDNPQNMLTALIESEAMEKFELHEHLWGRLMMSHPTFDERKKYIEEYCRNNSK